MDTNILLEKIDKSPSKATLDAIELHINWGYAPYKNHIVGLRNIVLYWSDQLTQWNKIIEKTNSQRFVRVRNLCQNSLDKVSDFVNRVPTQRTNFHSELQPEWNIWTTGVDGQDKYRALTAEHPKTKFLIKHTLLNPATIDIAYDILVNQLIAFQSTPEYALAINLAAKYEESLGQEVSKTNRLDKKWVTDVLTLFEKTRSELRSEFETTTSQLSNESNNLLDEFKSLISTSDSKLVVTLEEYKTSVDAWLVEEKSKAQKNQESFINMEEAFRQKLELEAPAQYWDTRAKDLKVEVRSWINWLIAVSFASLVGISIFIYLVPNVFSDSSDYSTLDIFKISTVVFAGISIAAYLIRTFTKLTLSTQHLARDAEERRVLTIYYLALLKDGAASSDERNLILQSLFSRSETGLLKDDSTPKMPGNIFGQNN